MIEMTYGNATIKAHPSKVESLMNKGWTIVEPDSGPALPEDPPAEPELDEADEAQEEE